MASGIAHAGLTDNDADARHPVLDTVEATNGDEYIYLKGVASTTAGDVVTYDEAGQTALLVADAIGPCAVAQAATVANEFGWYQIRGQGSVNCAAGMAADARCYATATAGTIDDAVVAGDDVKNMLSQTAISGGQCTVTMNYPYVNDLA